MVYTCLFSGAMSDGVPGRGRARGGAELGARLVPGLHHRRGRGVPPREHAALGLAAGRHYCELYDVLHNTHATRLSFCLPLHTRLLLILTNSNKPLLDIIYSYVDMCNYKTNSYTICFKVWVKYIYK